MESSLRGLGNLVRRDFPEFEIPGASQELESLLAELRRLPREGLAERANKLIGDENALGSLDINQARGICSGVAGEGNVELAAEFWVAYLQAKSKGEQKFDFKSANFNLLARKPFEGTLDLVDSVRFVRLVGAGLSEQPQLAISMNYTRDMLQWREEFAPYRQYGKDTDPSGLAPHLDKVLQREGVTEFDKRVIGAFLIKGNFSGRAKDTSQEVYRVQLEQSSLAEHSPGIAETLVALSQLEGDHTSEQDLKAAKVIAGYLVDQELAPDLRADLAKSYLAKLERDEALRELADAESIGVALRDLLMRGSYGATGALPEAGEMLRFVNEHLAAVPAKLQQEIYEGWILALKEDSKKVLKQRLSSQNRPRLSGVLFDFLDGGKRFPLPQELSDEVARSFVGDLNMMQRLVRAGNEALFKKLLPAANEDFRLASGEYSVETLELRKELWELLPKEQQVRLMCYLASLRDNYQWEKSEVSAGHRKEDRAIAAAKLFVANPPEKQEVRLKAIDDVESSVEALRVLMPLFNEQLQDDVPALVKNHRGEVRYLLRWMKAGGEETLKAFAPDLEKPLRMYGIREFDPALARLKGLMVPLLSDAEMMRFTCDLAVLRDPQVKDEEEGVLPTQATRLEEAARYILANPLPEVNSEEEKTCIALLVKAGLDEALTQELMLRHAQELEEFDEETLLAMRSGERELFAFQLRASLEKGDVTSAARCLRVLTESEGKSSTRSSLLGLVLPKITLPLIAHIAQEDDESGEKLSAEMKDLSTKLFRMTFVEDKMRMPDAAQRAVLFMTFATHCLGGDKAGYEALLKEISAKGKRLFEELARTPTNWSGGS